MAFQAPKWQGDPKRFTAELLDWLEAAGATRYDEIVTQYEHAVQSAALAAQRSGNPAATDSSRAISSTSASVPAGYRALSAPT